MDYGLVESPIYNNITQFKVLPPEYDSKLAPIIIVKASRLEIPKEKLSNPIKVYKWDNQGAALFR